MHGSSVDAQFQPVDGAARICERHLFPSVGHGVVRGCPPDHLQQQAAAFLARAAAPASAVSPPQELGHGRGCGQVHEQGQIHG